jgi:hypothetical protein
MRFCSSVRSPLRWCFAGSKLVRRRVIRASRSGWWCPLQRAALGLYVRDQATYWGKLVRAARIEPE